jgi:hypothetical protein
LITFFFALTPVAGSAKNGIFPVISDAFLFQKLQIVLALCFCCAYSVTRWHEVGKNVSKWESMGGEWRLNKT